jgi:2-desacetyl-2-hydroxyethyl bacteriochlorophyllide A dehydrogenase
MKCKGIVATGPGVVELIDVEVFDPKPDEVQVRMASTLVSAGTERAWILGLENSRPSYPYIPGYCSAGWVEKIGSEVKNLAVGDRVACYAVDVGHRQIGNVPAYRVVPIPQEVSFNHAAFTSLGQTSLQGVRKCKIELGESSASIGLGIVGLLALQLAKLNGSDPVIGIDLIESRLEIALACGATQVLHSKDAESALTKDRRPVVVFENTGVPAVMNQACALSKEYGRICILGCPRGTVDFNFYTLVQKKTLSIIGAHAVDSIPRHYSYPNYWTFADDAQCFLRFLEQGRIILDPMISDIVGWEDAISVYRSSLKGDFSSLGIVIEW